MTLAPELPRSLQWLNAPATTLHEQRGRIVALAFVNGASAWCAQRLNDLAMLQARYLGRLHALAIHVPEYYDYASVSKYMEGQGVKEGTSDNMHDDPIITLNMFIDDPNSVRSDARVKAKKATINGVDISDRKKNTELAKKIVEFRATRTVEAINKHIAAKTKAT